ncbi:MAG TPA: 4Fe-4S dicluster domain-containing protein [Planctomycetota bacterium]|nr:4Fe-4S dicluster domain-containing protein [Planctomycetota bacterium]
MSASLGLAGIYGCNTQPAPKIVPYAQPPEDVVPGKPMQFATALTLGGIATGVLATSNLGRPTKIEGNPDHPASLGACDAISQAAILSLYDPDRSQNVLRAGTISTWGDFLADLSASLEEQRRKNGGGLRLLTETITSPTLSAQIAEVLAQFKDARWHSYEPINRDSAREGAVQAFGEDANIFYRLDHAQTIVSLGADFLGCGSGHLRYAHDFAAGRKVRAAQTKMNRLYALETTPTITGAAADHRMPVLQHELERFAIDLAKALSVTLSNEAADSPDPRRAHWIEALVRELNANTGASAVIPGFAQPPFIHALCHAINDKLKNIGSTVILSAPLEAQPANQIESLRDLTKDMRAGKVGALIMLGGNPIYNAPADLDFKRALERVEWRAHLSLYNDETSRLCHWHIPQTHELESWSDARAYDGTVSIMQPLILPLYGGKSPHELLNVMSGASQRENYDILRDAWRGRNMGPDFESAWRRAVHDGVVKDSALSEKKLSIKTLSIPKSNASAESLLIVFAPDSALWDGRFANNGWLQELPRPLTRLTWDNAALISPRTAKNLQLSNEQLVEIALGERTLRAPIWITPGHTDGAVTLTLGQGRTHAGSAGTGIGYNAYALRTSDALWHATNVTLKPTQEIQPLSATQTHHSLEGRDLVHDCSLDDFKKLAVHAAHHEDHPATLYPGFKDTGHAWGMLVDLGACIGCAACVLGCQSENNIPIVGKDEVRNGREMHWLRIDRYYKGDADNPQTLFEPLACVHCETAPCEVVCPVAATSHSSEGLNQMVYNRCIGTRYCSNNCPYKVRRFNFLQYSPIDSAPLMLMQNPDVTVRERGVMEKCSYCIQRINAARVEAEKQNRPLRDGEIVTACQGACPTEAIVFGDIKDPESRVSKLKREPHNFGLLSELGTKPRTTYLGHVSNPNSDLAEPKEARAV